MVGKLEWESSSAAAKRHLVSAVTEALIPTVEPSLLIHILHVK